MAMLPPNVRHNMLPGAHQKNHNPQAAFIGATTPDGASVFQGNLRSQQSGNRAAQNAEAMMPQAMTQMREAGVSAASAQGTQAHAAEQAAAFTAAEAMQASTADPKAQMAALQAVQRHKARTGTPTVYLDALGQMVGA